MPASASVGISATDGDRLPAVIATTFRRPVTMCGRTPNMDPKPTCTSFDSIAVITDEVPLYGICVSFAPER